jgi:gamma-glutamyltranspeptidase
VSFRAAGPAFRGGSLDDIGGSGIAVPGYGFLLNDELTDFDDLPTGSNAPDGGKLAGEPPP